MLAGTPGCVLSGGASPRAGLQVLESASEGLPGASPLAGLSSSLWLSGMSTTSWGTGPKGPGDSWPRALSSAGLSTNLLGLIGLPIAGMLGIGGRTRLPDAPGVSPGEPPCHPESLGGVAKSRGKLASPPTVLLGPPGPPGLANGVSADTVGVPVPHALGLDPTFHGGVLLKLREGGWLSSSSAAIANESVNMLLTTKSGWRDGVAVAAPSPEGPRA